MLLPLRARADFPATQRPPPPPPQARWPAAIAAPVPPGGHRKPSQQALPEAIGERYRQAGNPTYTSTPLARFGRTEVIDLCQKTVTRSIDVCSLCIYARMYVYVSL